MKESPYLERKKSIHPIQEYDRERLEREKFLPDVRYLHEEREIFERSRSMRDIYFVKTSSEDEDD